MERKQYTLEEIKHIELMIDNYISVHDRYSIKELCQQEEYALDYFVSKALYNIATVEHIKNIIE